MHIVRSIKDLTIIQILNSIQGHRMIS